MRIVFCRFLPVFFAFATGLFAQGISFEKITIEHGLSQGMVFDILQTRDGFLWVATKDGLNRYDGYNFKIFSNDPFDAYSLAENTATQLLEDAKGRLWVGLQNKGLDLYDPTTGRFHHFPVDAKRDASRLGSSVEDIVEVPADQSVWALLSDGTLLRFALPADWDKGLPLQPDLKSAAPPTFVPLPALQNPVQPEKPERFRGLDLRPNGELLVFSEKMYYTVEPITRTARLDSASARLEKVVLCSALAHRKGAELRWMVRASANASPAEAVLCRLYEGREQCFPLPPDKWDLWKRLLPGADGHVWMVIGRSLWNLAPDETPDFSKPDLTLDAVPTVWIHDRNGNFWSGTIGYGLRKICHLREVFHAGAADKTLHGVWKHQGRYFARWVNEIRSYDPQTGLLADRRSFPDAPMLQLALAFEPSGAIWLLCTSDGKGTKPMLRRYAPGNTVAAERVFEFDAPMDLRHPLLRTRDGHLWIATHGGRLVRLDPASGQFDHFDPSHLFGEKAAAVRAVALAEAANGVLWIGTNLGLVKASPARTGRGLDFQRIQADSSRPDGLNNNSIACLLPAADGHLWIGTKGGGINVLDPANGHCRHITTADGLPNNVVYGILPGHRAGEFWCSTNRGLAKISLQPATEGKGEQRLRISAFTAAMGLQDNEFNTGAYFRADDGELLFGGVNGLNRFFPENLQLDDKLPPVYVVGLEINNQKVRPNTPDGPLSAPLEQTARIELSHSQNNLAFEFAALDFTDPTRNRYQYRLEGLDDGWIEVGNRRFAYFNHLSPGRYVFRVQGSNGESAWKEATPIVVVVRPPWWRSRLAWLCYTLLFVWAAWQVWRFQVKRLQEREQLAFEQREAERIRALEQMKTNFFSNITHEFRTPLTLIIEPLRQLLKNPDAPDRREKIRLAEGNSRKLLGLVNQLLDMAKLESGGMTLDLRRGSPGQVVQDVFETFLPLAEKRGIKLTLDDREFKKTDAPDRFLFDSGKIELVLNNLISNALKFTPSGGQVTVAGLLNLPGLSNLEGLVNLEISVSDTGIGIPAEALPKVFDRFYQVDGSHTRTGEGTGIGLALCKELAELMGGSITAESTPGQGSTFRFRAPLHFDHSGAEAAETLVAEPVSPHSTALAGDEAPVVLVVEDNVELRYFIKQSIGANWQVVEAADGEEGIEKALELLPDLIISDLMMPRRDGFAVCDELKNKELTAHIPIILLTAKSGIESRLAGLRRGADDYLTKPFSTEELLVRMENLLENRRRLRKIFGAQVANGSVPAAGPEAFLTELDAAFLQKFTDLVETNLDNENLSLDYFAQQLFVSRSQLQRKVKALLDQTPMDFVRNHRLQCAFVMLKNREGRVGEIALRVGFSNEKYFSTAFRERFNVSPSQVLG